MNKNHVEEGSSKVESAEAIRTSALRKVQPANLDETGISQNVDPTTPTRNYIAGEGGYNDLKSFNGQVYSGMAVGGSHTWNYDQGVWKETKTEPDLWTIDYETTKRRAKNAPEGSGAAVGTEYHWLVVAHQYVKKVDANTYETHLVGSKYKLAHKGANSASWSIPTVKAQREQELLLLEDARRRIEGLPPVLASEKVKVSRPEKGQQKLDSLFSKSPAKSSPSFAEKGASVKRRRDEGDDQGQLSLDEVTPEKRRRIVGGKENVSPQT